MPKPVGLMACNDDLSREVAQACIMAGLRVPDEVAILGVDNDELVCNLTLPPLTSILLNHEIIGYEAGKQLDRLMSGKKASEHTLFVKPIHIEKRQSTNILAIKDEDVVSAIRFIRNNSDRQISVVDVVNETTLSTRVLQSRFRKILDRSIHEEIRRVRIERFCKMLLETNLSIYQIAMDLDFRDVNHVARAFRKEKGMTPLRYRNKFEDQ